MKAYFYTISAIIISSVSGNCLSQTTFPINSTSLLDMTYEDSDFGTVKRQFWINIPKSYNHKKKHPLLLYFHGTGPTFEYIEKYIEMGDKENMITVFPQGMADGSSGKGWNVPFRKGDTSICLPDTNGPCYDSCAKLKSCNTCSWITCYNDLEFMDQLIDHLKAHLCLDSQEFYIGGESNGAMFMYYISSLRPDTFKGWIYKYGQPLVGYLKTVEAIEDKKILVLHGRQDTIIPIAGGLDDSGYFYEPEDSMLQQWAVMQKCDMHSYQQVKTPYDDYVKEVGAAGSDMTCFEWTKGCKGRIMRCTFEAQHANQIPQDALLALWFFNGTKSEQIQDKQDKFIQ